jgi:hypothetical protein
MASRPDASAPSRKPQAVPRRAPEPEPEEEEEEEDDEFDEEGDYDEFEEGMDLGAVLEPFLATEDGQTIATALVSISKHMENQNKILIKMLSQMSKPAVAAVAPAAVAPDTEA